MFPKHPPPPPSCFTLWRTPLVHCPPLIFSSKESCLVPFPPQLLTLSADVFASPFCPPPNGPPRFFQPSAFFSLHWTCEFNPGFSLSINFATYPSAQHPPPHYFFYFTYSPPLHGNKLTSSVLSPPHSLKNCSPIPHSPVKPLLLNKISVSFSPFPFQNTLGGITFFL